MLPLQSPEEVDDAMFSPNLALLLCTRPPSTEAK